jgi:adenylate cyclase
VAGFDAVFAEPDRSGDENDTAFSTAMQNQSTVLGWFGDPAENLDVDGGLRFSPHLRPMQSEDQGSGSSESFSSVLHTGEQLLNINKLEHASRGAGLLVFGVDGDGVVRSVPLVFVAGGVLQPSFALEVVRVARAEKATGVLFSPQGLDGVKFTDEALVATNDAGEILLRFRPLEAKRNVSFIDVIEGRVDGARLKDKIVLIGATASGLHDQIFTPLGDVVPGVMIHAMAIEQILNSKTLYRLHELRGAEVIFVAILGVVLISIFSKYPTQWAVLALVIMEAGLFGGTAWLFTHSQIVMYPLYPALSLLGLFMVMLFIRTLSLERSGA